MMGRKKRDETECIVKIGKLTLYSCSKRAQDFGWTRHRFPLDDLNSSLIWARVIETISSASRIDIPRWRFLRVCLM